MMQIKDLIIYNHSGEKRVIKFNLDALNIITGRSDSGKTSIIPFIRYCLGSSELEVAHGIIRKHVQWYGLRLQFDNSQILILRQAPKNNGKSNTRTFIIEGNNVQIPSSPPESPNSDINSSIEIINRRLGIGLYKHETPDGWTRPDVYPHIKHALSFCLQRQTEIASDSVLFHRHNISFVEQAGKDTLPYFLGVFREDQMLLESKLKELKREKKILNRKLKELRQIKGDGASTGLELYSEAREANLVAGEPPMYVREIYDSLAHLKEWKPSVVKTNESDDYNRNLNKINDCESRLMEIEDSISSIDNFAKGVIDFKKSSFLHKSRLESVNYFTGVKENLISCPLCENAITDPFKGSLDKLKERLTTISGSVDEMMISEPKISEHLSELREEKNILINLIDKANAEVKGIVKNSEAIQKIKDIQIRQAIVVGKIQLWLSKAISEDEEQELIDEIDILDSEIGELLESIGDFDFDEKILAIQSIISAELTNLSRNILHLRHSNYPIRLDLKKLDVVIESPDNAISLKSGTIGGAQNWLGYHLATFFALHRYLVSKKRPVPSFCVFDQPSQVYFPKNAKYRTKEELKSDNDIDTSKVEKLFEFFSNQVNSIGKFQLIVLDHADMDNEIFQESVIEKWWGVGGLIPEKWLSKKEIEGIKKSM